MKMKNEEETDKTPVSYTHLDVYKRQQHILHTADKCITIKFLDFNWLEYKFKKIGKGCQLAKCRVRYSQCATNYERDREGSLFHTT